MNANLVAMAAQAGLVLAVLVACSGSAKAFSINLYPPPGTMLIDVNGAMSTPIPQAGTNGYFVFTDPYQAGNWLVRGWGTSTCLAGPANSLKPGSGSTPQLLIQLGISAVGPNSGGYFLVTDGQSAGALLNAGWITGCGPTGPIDFDHTWFVDEAYNFDEL